MAIGQSWAARGARLTNRYHARMAGRTAAATGFVSSPEPRTIGRFAKGRQLVAGNFLFSGQLIEAPGASIWEIGPEEAGFAAELHGFGWLDDLAAIGDAKARDRAQTWLFDWIRRYGDGTGPGWSPDLTGRRLIRWISHALLILRGQDKGKSDFFYASLTRQSVYLSKRWRVARPGLPRFEALTGMVYAGLSLEGMESYADPAIAALANDCAQHIDSGGAIPTRNPEELLEIFTLLTWAAQSLAEAAKPAPKPLLAAIARIAPTLRGLRHSDGGLARFHGGGRGMEGRLDQALAASGVRDRRRSGLHMGFARLSAGRTTLIADAASPPTGAASHEAHASTLAFELTSGRRQLIVNCGAGTPFGEEWRRAGRATPSHSTLGVEGYSSARLAHHRSAATHVRERLIDGPDKVPAEIRDVGDRTRLEIAHNGWQKTHGLTHARTLDLSYDGRTLRGEDLLTTLSSADKLRFDRAMDDLKLQGITVSVRFHLHPEVEAALDMGGKAVSLTLKSGEVWVFQQRGDAQLTLEPSVFLENGRLKPRASKQVVLSGRAMTYATRIRWTLSKAKSTPDTLRDLASDDPFAEVAIE